MYKINSEALKIFYNKLLNLTNKALLRTLPYVYNVFLIVFLMAWHTLCYVIVNKSTNLINCVSFTNSEAYYLINVQLSQINTEYK